MKKQQQKLLKELSDIFLLDSGNYRKFTTNNLFDATFIFSSVLFDKIYTHKMYLSDKEIIILVEKIGKDIRNLIIEATGLDMHEVVKITNQYE
jgi:hypothetical protein